MSRAEDVKKVADYLVYCISKRVPLAEVVYASLKFDTRMPLLVPKGSNFTTDGITLYVREEIVEAYHKHRTMLEKELLHELLHVYMGHPVFAAQNVHRRKHYDRASDKAADAWVLEVYDSIHWDWYNIRENKNHAPWYKIKNEEAVKAVWERMQDDIALLSSSIYSEGGALGIDSGLRSEHSSVAGEMTLSYTDILRRYIKIEEQTCYTDEEIDLLLYSYGFQLYRDISFVEPPERTDMPVVSFCMAIDTSDSCSGELVEKFFSQTKKVIEDISGNGKYKIDICLILCDEKIEQEIFIESPEQFPKAEELKITYGGTDFRPVFKRMEELRTTCEKHYDALFYYTDGEGEYPEKQPSFDTYFLMDAYDMENYCGPEWIQKIKI